MKKACLVLLIFLTFLNCAFCDDDMHFRFGSGNDKFTYGISQNADDQLTFSGLIEFSYDNFSINLDMKAFTDRGSRPNGVFRNGRLDFISLDTKYNKHLKVNDKWSFDLDGAAGVGMVGKLYFDAVQNHHHGTVGVSSVDIPYDWEHVKVSPIVDVGFGINYDLRYLRFRLYSDYRNNIFFVSKKNAFVEISAFDNLFYSRVGLLHAVNNSGSKTMDTVIASTEGLMLDFGINAAPYVMDWTYFPMSGYGFGTYYIDVMPVFDKNRSWTKSDVYVYHGLSSFYDMELMNVGLSVPITDFLSGVAGIRYVSGFPEASSDVRVQRNYSLYEIGVSYEPVNWFISPYLQAMMGVGTFQINYLTNSDSESSGAPVSLPRTSMLLGDLRFGLNIVPEGLAAFGLSTYQVQVFCGTHVVPWFKTLSAVLEKDYTHASEWMASVLGPYLGIGVNIGIDIPGV